MDITVHRFARSLVRSQVARLVLCDYGDYLTIFPDRVEQPSAWNEDDEAFDDARRTLAHLIGTAIDQAGYAIDYGEPGARNDQRQLYRLLAAVALTERECDVPIM